MRKSERAQVLAETQLFGSLQEIPLQELAAKASERRLEKGEVLFVVGEPAERLFVIVFGAVRAYRVNGKGREQTIHIEHAGATLAEVPVFDDGPYPATVVAEEATGVLAIDRRELKALCFRHPEVAWSALTLLAGRLRRHADLIDQLSLQDVGPRLARFLLAEARDRGTEGSDGSIRLQLQLSQQQLASTIGSVREVVSRSFTRLEKTGLIRVDSGMSSSRAYEVLILNREELESYAGLQDSSIRRRTARTTRSHSPVRSRSPVPEKD